MHHPAGVCEGEERAQAEERGESWSRSVRRAGEPAWGLGGGQPGGSVLVAGCSKAWGCPGGAWKGNVVHGVVVVSGVNLEKVGAGEHWEEHAARGFIGIR